MVKATEIRGIAKSTIKGITSAISMFDNSFLKNEGMLSKYPYGSFQSLPPQIACNKCVYLDFLGYMTKATQMSGKPYSYGTITEYCRKLIKEAIPLFLFTLISPLLNPYPNTRRSGCM